MADEIKVKQTPVQRNNHDVAVELTKMYFQTVSVDDISIEYMQEVYLKFYATAKAAEYVGPINLKDYLPEQLKTVIQQY
ncbi:hypothetical protein [Anaerosolibacter sp.]|uniref:hypothetical protein n=1 Tax=Anaerosolibacter sp. TaxID=1872527 RepID=UPI0039EFD2B3